MNIQEFYGTLLSVSKESSKVKSFLLTLGQSMKGAEHVPSDFIHI